MEIRIINPNTTASMTEKIGRAAQEVAATGAVITAINSADEPASIEGHYDEAFAVPGLLREIRRGESQGVAGYIIACHRWCSGRGETGRGLGCPGAQDQQDGRLRDAAKKRLCWSIC